MPDAGPSSALDRYRSLARCRIPEGECPWDESEHVEAREIVAEVDAIIAERERLIYTLQRIDRVCSSGSLNPQRKRHVLDLARGAIAESKKEGKS